MEKMAEVQLQRLLCAVDRLTGPVPEKDPSMVPNKLSGVPSGIMGEVLARTASIERKLNYINSLLSRLERV
jgi:hypothetical protein